MRVFAEGGVALAYLCLVAAVPEDQVKAMQTDVEFVLTPTLIKGVSHLLSYWNQVQPLGHVLNQFIDGGDYLNKEFWHPLRPPMVHLPDAVVKLTKNLKSALSDVGDDSGDKDEWLTSEMTRLLAIVNHAVDAGECIVTALDLPGDHDRAKRIRIPWMPPTAERGAPPRSRWKLW